MVCGLTIPSRFRPDLLILPPSSNTPPVCSFHLPSLDHSEPVAIVDTASRRIYTCSLQTRGVRWSHVKLHCSWPPCFCCQSLFLPSKPPTLRNPSPSRA